MAMSGISVAQQIVLVSYQEITWLGKRVHMEFE